MPAITYLTHMQSFCAAHRLHNSELTDEENRHHFGKCNHPSSHGHNYKVEATVKGETIPKLGYAMNLTELKKYIIAVTDRLDHKRIDTDIDFFKQRGVVSTAENIAIYIWQELEKALPPTVKLHNIRLHETDKNYIDYKG